MDEWRERGDWNHIRQQIIDRHKVCRICGGQRFHRAYEIKADARYPSRIPETRLTTGWDVDHIVACEDGGTDDPQNLRLLCRACHKDVTRLQRKLKAMRRRFGRLLVLPSD